MAKKKLSKKQEMFVKEYLIDLNATQAAIRAGYSKDTAGSIGFENLTKPEIASKINSAMEKRSQAVEITAEKVLKIITDTIERCQQARPVLDKFGKNVLVETEDGEIVPAYVFEPNAVLRGAELLGKHIKMFTDKVEHSGNVETIVSVVESDIEDRISKLKKAKK
jgi:phage terminase small subunit